MPVVLTPRWNIQKIAEKNVYEPSEDTFLLIDAIEDDIATVLACDPKVILEVGCGSGVVISALASIFQNRSFCMAVDISENACIMTKETAALNGVEVDVFRGDLLCNLRLRNTVDVIIFNPPYVRTEAEEVKQVGISQSWAGGVHGRDVIDRILPQLQMALSENGLFYLVVIEYNMIDDILGRMAKFSFVGSVVMKRQIRGELLSVLRFVRK